MPPPGAMLMVTSEWFEGNGLKHSVASVILPDDREAFEHELDNSIRDEVDRARRERAHAGGIRLLPESQHVMLLGHEVHSCRYVSKHDISSEGARSGRFSSQ